jgi:hypothetical protein
MLFFLLEQRTFRPSGMPMHIPTVNSSISPTCTQYAMLTMGNSAYLEAYFPKNRQNPQLTLIPIWTRSEGVGHGNDLAKIIEKFKLRRQ